MSLSKEQEDIIKQSQALKPNEILKIQACAGSGKTTTLCEIAKANPNKKFLYLAFNKAIAQEMKAKMPSNVESKTIHALAFANAKQNFGNFSLINKLTVFDIEPFFALKVDELSVILKEFESFCKSDLSLHLASPQTKEMWNLILSSKLPFTHDFYLKHYALSKNNLDSKYDFVMLDEAQDTNAVMLQIFLNNRCSKILVGDAFQNIYGFNETINALDILNSTFSMELNTSFRSKQEILDYANFFLNTFSNKKQPKMLSGNSNQKEIETKAFITRTNAGLVSFLAKLIDENKEIKEYYLDKEANKLFELPFAIIDFKNGEIVNKRFAFLNRFSDLEAVYDYAIAINDLELKNSIALSKKYTLDELKSFYDLALELNANKKAKNIIINAHQAKGLEWDFVELQDDFSGFFDLIFNLDRECEWNPFVAKDFDFAKFYDNFQEELNLFYVAITRARFGLKDKSHNKHTKKIIEHFKLDVLEHLRRRENGDFRLLFDKEVVKEFVKNLENDSAE